MDASSYLAGTRYLLPTGTTWIFEYYHNGEGYGAREAEGFYSFAATADDSELTAARPDLSGYQSPNYGRHYLYVKASQREPFGWLYVTPAWYSVINLEDGSYSVIPEVSYTGLENLELRFRLNLLRGGEETEYADKLNDWRLELRVRYFF